MLNQVVSNSLTRPARDRRFRRQAITNDRGRFTFVDVPVATNGYLVYASRPGYFEGAFGRGPTHTQALSIDLGPGMVLEDANIELLRPASIGGTVFSASGRSLAGVQVRALERSIVAGSARWLAAQTAISDDRGAYSITGLNPGRYTVVVSKGFEAQPGGADTSPPVPLTFLPDSPTPAAAQMLALDYGSSVIDMDIDASSGAGHRVAGRLSGRVAVVDGGILRLVPAGAEDLGLGAETAIVYPRPDGSFEFRGVSRGTYELSLAHDVSGLMTGGAEWLAAAALHWAHSTFAVIPPGDVFVSEYKDTTAQLYFGRATVTVGDSDVDDIVLAAHRGAVVMGRLIWDPEPAAPVDSEVDLSPSLATTLTGTRNVGVRGSDSFAFENVPDGDYFIDVGAGSVESITSNGRDYRAMPMTVSGAAGVGDIVVRLSNRVLTLSGTVRGRDGRPVSGADVVVFPTDRAQWKAHPLYSRRLRATRASTSGVYTIQDLPCGDYYVATPPSTDRINLDDVGFLEQAARGARTAAAELPQCDHLTVDLLVRGPS